MNTDKAKAARDKAKIASGKKAPQKKAATPTAAAAQKHPEVAAALARNALLSGGMAPESAGIGLGQSADLQPADGVVNPFHMMGTVNPNTYNPGNVIGGF
jgi:hypothetical protein